MPNLLGIEKGKTKKFGCYTVRDEPIGLGRYAEVYQAFDSGSQTDVAFKLYREASEKADEMARAEDKVLQRLASLKTAFFPERRRFLIHRVNNQNHPAIVMEVGYYVGDDSKKRIISLQEMIHGTGGGSTSNREPGGFWDFDRLRTWILDLSEAVRLLHKNDIIHRDLKPANILVKKDAGMSEAVPFILDFNTSTGAIGGSRSGGTESYLPPEVVTGARKETTTADDLWALAKVIEELCQGGTGEDQGGTSDHELSALLTGVLSIALSEDPAGRFQTMDEFYLAVQDALGLPEDATASVSTDELAWCREERERIRNCVVGELAGIEELPVSKEVHDKVVVIYSDIYSDQSRSFDIKDELVHLGPQAIPSIIEEGYKVRWNTGDYDAVVQALVKLSAEDIVLTQRAIEQFCLSGSFSVRKLCISLCQRLCLFPLVYLEILADGSELLTKDEEEDISLLCINHGIGEKAVAAIAFYLCREYCVDPDGFNKLRHSVAQSISKMNYGNKADFIYSFTSRELWRELPEFTSVSPQMIKSTELSIVELLGFAFAELGEEGLNTLKGNSIDRGRHWSRFAQKLARVHPPTAEWLRRELKEKPWDRDVEFALKEAKKSRDQSIDISKVLHEYLQSETDTTVHFNSLRFSGNSDIFRHIRNEMQPQAITLQVITKIVHLLKGFENRHRNHVVSLALEKWDLLSKYDYETMISIVSWFRVSDAQLRDKLVRHLEAEFRSRQSEVARKGLARVLDKK